MEWLDVWKVDPPRNKLILARTYDYPYLGEVSGEGPLDSVLFDAGDDVWLMGFANTSKETTITHWCDFPEIPSEEEGE